MRSGFLKLVLWALLLLILRPSNAPADTGLLALIPSVTSLRSWYGDLREPARLAADASGNIYISDPRGGQVVVRSPDGLILERRAFDEPLAIGIDSAGNVLIGDAVRRNVSAWDSSWRQVYELGIGQSEFRLPSDIAVHSSGRIFVSDSEASLVRAYHPGGAFAFEFDGTGTDPDTRLEFPTGLTLLEGELYVASQRSRKVVIFDLDGDPLGSFGDHGEEAGELYSPQGMAADVAEGRLWITDSRVGRVSAFDVAGGYLASAGSHGQRVGQLRIPLDAVLDPFGRLFVTSANNNRIEMYGVDSYTDPERYAPAESTLFPLHYVRDGLPGEAVAHIRIHGYPLMQVDLGTVTANGVVPLSAEIRDADGDHVPEIVATFERLDLLGTLPRKGTGVVELRGSLPNLEFVDDHEVTVEVLDSDDEEDDVTLGGRKPRALTADEANAKGSGCACSQTSTPHGLAWGLFGLGLLRRRRQA